MTGQMKRVCCLIKGPKIKATLWSNLWHDSIDLNGSLRVYNVWEHTRPSLVLILGRSCTCQLAASALSVFYTFWPLLVCFLSLSPFFCFLVSYTHAHTHNFFIFLLCKLINNQSTWPCSVKVEGLFTILGTSQQVVSQRGGQMDRQSDRQADCWISYCSLG